MKDLMKNVREFLTKQEEAKAQFMQRVIEMQRVPIFSTTNMYAPFSNAPMFRVYDEYETVLEVIDGEETTIRRPVPGSGYKDKYFDYKGEHKNFFIELANCIPVELHDDGLYTPVWNDTTENIDYDRFDKALFALINRYGNLGCSVIKQRHQTNVEDLHFHVQIQDDTKRKPSKIEAADVEGQKTFTYIANYDVVTQDFSASDLDEIPMNPSLYKAVWDLSKMANLIAKKTEALKAAKEKGVEPAHVPNVDVDILNAHLAQCNVSVSTKVTQTTKGTIYELAPNADNLLGIAFWQVQQALIQQNSSKIGICEKCGSYFEVRSPSGRFCNDVVTENGVKVKKGCASAYHTLKARVKKEYESDASLTVEDLVLKHKRSAKYVREFVAEWEAKGIKRKAPAEK